ncbi:SH3 domain-containing protein [Alteromonas sp. 1_MG-2023]|uniref:SH3 domain-containing protein n=1 Tax=Alteromonas sp. 1_MG-2023 TaxID=3062669 RepID=UPI0026E488E4|nr:SH3 domain-containing protein [Alteromonas sp. 1_MG-2023]MDO6565560.1 SH3 domain-containing protein [Alteromonas sp. 1_MG-2023]
MNKIMSLIGFLCVALACSFSLDARSDDVVVKVVEQYADMHTGPASEFPVFHVIEKGETITVLKSHTNWYRVRTGDDKYGWIAKKSLAATLGLDDSPIQLNESNFESYVNRTWEFGLHAGMLDDVTAMTVSGAWVLTDNIAIEASVGQALGNFSDNRFWLVRFQHYTFPEWKLSPYFTLGAGQIRTEPSATLVQSGAESRTNDLLEVGAGARYYLTKNFVVRAEYKRLTALTERDELEELNIWTLGLSVFF